MKKYCFFGLVLFLITIGAYAQKLPTVRVINNTGYTIFYLYISETSTEDWEEDVLDEDILEDGDYVDVKLSYPLNVVNRYDIMVEDEDGDTYTKLNVLIKENTRIEFTIEDLDL